MGVRFLLSGRDMAYRKVHAGLRGALHSQDLESDELQAAVELEWDMEKELEEPGLDRFQLEDGEQHSVGNSSRVADLDLEPIEPSTSPHGRFERLQEDPDYVSHFTRPPPKSPLRPGCSLTCYVLLGVALFVLGLLIGRFAHRPAPDASPAPGHRPLPKDRAGHQCGEDQGHSEVGGLSESIRASGCVSSYRPCVKACFFSSLSTLPDSLPVPLF
ncbi:hypothetical protein ANANG_G00094140 [Anguilla anguilla]|uniref:Uncharacterized protein n=1 Tax=Anguilla anguilla TaxID=7936 RepID=A0A9D3MMB4_ANGAN|nr:hypothetical protein ANANG_G00094140 [Anguilla anguilla]